MPPSPPYSRHSPVGRIMLAAVVCLIAAVLVVVVNLSSVLTSRAPATASSLFFANARARASVAQQVILDRQMPDAARRAITLARNAVANDPIVPVALSAAGLAFEQVGEGVRTRPAMLLADRLSRRLLPVQMWLIEDAVQRGDISATLHRYDVALRSNRQASSILFPILSAAVGDSSMVRPIARVLAKNPAWRPDFTAQLVDQGHLAGTTALATTLAAMRSPLPDEHADVLMLRLSRERDYNRARAVFRANFPAAARVGALVRDQAFAAPGTALPFGWQFVDSSEFGVAPAVGGRSGAQVYADPGASGEAARQLVMLPPGPYRLLARYANADVVRGSEPRWQVVCGSEAAPRLADLPLVATVAERRVGVGFDVPAQGCPAQWVFLNIPAASGEAALSADLVALSVERTR